MLVFLSFFFLCFSIFPTAFLLSPSIGLFSLRVVSQCLMDYYTAFEVCFDEIRGELITDGHFMILSWFLATCISILKIFKLVSTFPLIPLTYNKFSHDRRISSSMPISIHHSFNVPRVNVDSRLPLYYYFFHPLSLSPPPRIGAEAKEEVIEITRTENTRK